MSAPDNLEYRLEQLVFQNGEELNFPASTRMLYGEQHAGVWIKMDPATRARIVGDVVAHNVPDGKFEELRRIYYAMLVTYEGRHFTLPFVHHLSRGSGVGLELSQDGQLTFDQTDRNYIFTKDYTLRQVSDGRIDSDFRVWQFHGYKHEH